MELCHLIGSSILVRNPRRGRGLPDRLVLSGRNTAEAGTRLADVHMPENKLHSSSGDEGIIAYPGLSHACTVELIGIGCCRFLAESERKRQDAKGIWIMEPDRNAIPARIGCDGEKFSLLETPWVLKKADPARQSIWSTRSA